MAYTEAQIEEIRNRMTEIPAEEYLKIHDAFLQHYPDVVRAHMSYDLTRAARSNILRTARGTRTPVNAMRSYAEACEIALRCAIDDVCVVHGCRRWSQAHQELLWALYDEGILAEAFREFYVPQIPRAVCDAYEEECRAQGLPEDAALPPQTSSLPRKYVPDPWPGSPW